MTTLDSRARFTETVDAYAKYRPTYPSGLIDWVLTTANAGPATTLVDIGCGTGISTRLFAEQGVRAIGIDPNSAMLASARAGSGSAQYVEGESNNTGLPDASADLVVAAQAFHWFDVPTTMAEWKRVLKRQGWCAAFWNLRKGNALVNEYEALLLELGEYRAVPKPEEAMARIDRSPGLMSRQSAKFAHVQVFDRDGLFGRARSSSYVVHDVAKAAFEERLDQLFAKHAIDGKVDFSYESVVRMWQFVDG